MANRPTFPYRISFEPGVEAIEVDVDATVEFTDQGITFRPVVNITPIVPDPGPGEDPVFAPFLDLDFGRGNLLRNG